MTEGKELQKRLETCRKVIVGLGEEWKAGKGVEAALKGYRALYPLLKDKDYFIVTMATDGVIFQTPLGSREEEAYSAPGQPEGMPSCGGLPKEALEKMDRLFPPRQKPKDTRWERVVAPCGNETWRQCSRSCTKDIWEPGEVPEDICPHCGAPLVGNTIEAQNYIEEGYLPQWNRYTRWLAETLKEDTLILELGAGFANPGILRFPFEKLVFFNQKAFLWRVHEKSPQIPQELGGRAKGICRNSVKWVEEYVNGRDY